MEPAYVTFMLSTKSRLLFFSKFMFFRHRREPHANQYQHLPIWKEKIDFILKQISEMQGMSCEGACAHARTRVMCGRTCACVCEILSGECAGCTCVRPFLGLAMCDRSFAHVCTLFARKCYVLEHTFLLWNILSCFGPSHSVFKHTKS